MKKLLIFLVLVGVVFAAGAYWINHARNGGAAGEGFTTTSVEFGTLTETVGATGGLQPHEVIPVGSMLSGQVVEIYPNAKVGNAVEEGAPLLKLDDREAQIKLQQARTAVELADKNVAMAEASRDGAQQKIRTLEKMDATVRPPGGLEEARMQLRQAEAAVAAARVKVQQAHEAVGAAQYALDLTTVRVRAGINGPAGPSSAKPRYWIIKRDVHPGQLIAPPVSAKLFILASDLNKMQVHAQVGENDIGKIQPGQAVSFTVFAYPDDHFKGEVTSIGLMDTDIHGARFYDTVIDTANRRDPRTKEWMLRPGMTASVSIILRTHPDVWKMPTAALSFQLDEQYQSEAAREKLAKWQKRKDYEDWKPVWVLKDHKPWPLFVRIGGKSASGETGIGDDQYIEILDWDPAIKPELKSSDPATYPQVITAAPPANKPGLFNQPNIKVW